MKQKRERSLLLEIAMQMVFFILFLIFFFTSGMENISISINRRRNLAIHRTIMMAAIKFILYPTTGMKHLTSVKLKQQI